MAQVWLPEPVKDLHSSMWQAVLGNVLEQEGNSSTVHILQAWSHCWYDSLIWWQVANHSHKVLHGQGWLRQAYVCEALSRIDACHLRSMCFCFHASSIKLSRTALVLWLKCPSDFFVCQSMCAATDYSNDVPPSCARMLRHAKSV